VRPYTPIWRNRVGVDGNPEVGPETLSAAMTLPSGPKIGAPMHLAPMKASSLS
jgi:hypothetical protein